MKKSTWKVHTIAKCEDCDWETGNYHNGQALAAIHAKHHHHKVTGDVGLCFEYDGREEI